MRLNEKLVVYQRLHPIRCRRCCHPLLMVSDSFGGLLLRRRESSCASEQEVYHLNTHIQILFNTWPGDSYFERSRQSELNPHLTALQCPRRYLQPLSGRSAEEIHPWCEDPRKISLITAESDCCFISTVNSQTARLIGPTKAPHLFQCGVGHSVAGDPKVRQLQVQVFEELHKGSVLGGAIRQDIGQLVSEVLDHAGGGHVAQDQT